LTHGWMPMTSTSEHIIWDTKKFNRLADHAANCTLNTRQSWKWAVNATLRNAIRYRFNLCATVDGARRGKWGRRSGHGDYSSSWKPEPLLLFRAGCPLGKLASAFLAELISFDWGFDKLAMLITRYSSNLICSPILRTIFVRTAIF